MSINFKHLKVFQAAMMHGSTVAAATATHVTQPSASRTIKELEEIVGFALFVREKTGLRPTREAELFYAEVKKACFAFTTVEDTARQIREKEKGIVRLACLPVYTDGIISSRIGEFMQLFPNVRIQLISASKVEITELVESGQVDMGIITLPEPSDAVKVHYSTTRSAVCISPIRSNFTDKTVVTMTDLLAENFIQLTPNSPLQVILDSKLQQSPGALVSTLEVETQRAAVNAVASGLGISVVDPDIISELDRNRISCHQLQPKLEWDVAVITPKRGTLSSIGVEFIDWLCQLLSKEEV